MGAKIAPQAIPQTAAEPEGFEVYPVNWPSVRTFLACETQWQVVAGMAGGQWLGLDYAGVDVVLRRSGLKDADAVFADIQIMEDAALKVFAESRP